MSDPKPARTDADLRRVLADFTVPSEPGRERLAMETVAQAVRDLDIRGENLERLKTAVAEATMQGRCQVRIYTESLCPRRAEVEILGVGFCGPSARKQEAYFSIGELTHEEVRDLRYENRGFLSLIALTRDLLYDPS